MKTGIGMFSNKNVIYEKELIRNSLLPLSCITAFLVSFSFAGWKLATQKQRAAEAEAAPPRCRCGKAVNHRSRQRVGRGPAVQMLALPAGIKHVYTQEEPHPWCGRSIHWDRLCMRGKFDLRNVGLHIFGPDSSWDLAGVQSVLACPRA